MSRALVASCVLVLGVGVLASCGAEQEEARSDGTVICDKRDAVIAADGETEMGTYGIRCILREKDQKYEIVESMAMGYRGKAAESTSTLVYGSTAPLTPEHGSAETKIDGRTCMQGTVTVSETTVSYEGIGNLDKKTGEAFAVPRKFGQKEELRPKGFMLFQSAFPAIGPRILPKEGELTDVVSVEFPDDLGAPELINFKTGYRLVRSKADKNGEYELALHDRSVRRVRFDKDDQIISIGFSKGMTLREVEE